LTNDNENHYHLKWIIKKAKASFFKGYMRMIIFTRADEVITQHRASKIQGCKGTL
jgi:hypothetical protein